MTPPRKPSPPSYVIGDVTVERDNFRVRRDGEALTLTPRAFDVLLFLIEHRGRVVEKSELFEQVWKETFVTDNALTRAVKEVRRALGDDADAPRFIETVHKRGYRFIAEVEEPDGDPFIKAEAGPAGPETAAAEGDSAETVAPPPPAPPPEARKAEEVPKVEPARAPSPARRLLIPLGVALALALAALVFWLARRNPEGSPLVSGVTRNVQVTLWPGLDDYPSISPDGNAVAYCSDHGGGFEIYVKALAPGAREVQLTNGGGQNFQPAFSPDGRQVAFYSKTRGGIWVVPASGGEARQLTDFGSAPAWSPDGKLVAFQSNMLTDLGPAGRNALSPSTLWLVPAAGGEPRQLTQVGNPPGGHGAPSFSPDGKRIAFELDEFNAASVWTLSLEGGDARRLSPSLRAYAPVYAPDGQSVLYTETGGVFQVRVSATGEPVGEPAAVKDIGGRTSFIRRLSFSADGKKMAYSLLNRSENISSVSLRPDSFEPAVPPAPLITNASSRNNFPVYSPDGGRIAFTSCNLSGTACDIWLANADGSDPAQLTTAESSEQMPAWFPDSQQIAFVSDREAHMNYWAINLNTRRERKLFDFGPGLDYMRLSPDGRSLAFNYKGGDGVINVWGAPLSGGAPAQLTFDKEQMGFPTWSPDSKYLAFQVKRGDDSHILVMPAGGGEATQLTNDRGQSWIFGWSPDGDKVLFAGFRDGLWNVRWVSRSTGKQRQLTDYRKPNSFVRYPSWSPKGDRVIYQFSETTGNIWVADLK